MTPGHATDMKTFSILFGYPSAVREYLDGDQSDE
jgi:hypothetical protein